MRVRIGLENGIEGRVLAWALDHPGCFSYGATEEEALVSMARTVPEYVAWMDAHTDSPWFSPEEIDIRLVEVFQVYYINEDLEKAKDGYEVNAWFLSDWIPLEPADIERGLLLLEWSRKDLLRTYQGLSQEVLDAGQGEGEYSLGRILRHIGTAEWWYLDRLGLSGGRSNLPDGTLERLHGQRTHLREVLPGLAGLHQVVGIDGEFWSPRKLLRRAVWHEIDHLLHARRLLGLPTRLA